MSTPERSRLGIEPADFEKLKKKVKAAVTENLAPDEAIRVIVHGANGQAIVGSDTRAFVCKPGFLAGATLGAEVTSWSYRNLLGVQVHKGMVSGAVVLQGPGQTGTKTSYWGGKGDDPYKAPNAIPVAGDWQTIQARVATLRQLIDAAHGSAVAPAPAPPASVADELRKLADLRTEGVLSEDEFAALKSKLLAEQ